MFLCPLAQKVAYESTMLAGNAVTLHEIQTACADCHYSPCVGSEPRHWHIGHRHHDQGDLCKAEHPFTRPERARA